MDHLYHFIKTVNRFLDTWWPIWTFFICCQHTNTKDKAAGYSATCTLVMFWYVICATQILGSGFCIFPKLGKGSRHENPNPWPPPPSGLGFFDRISDFLHFIVIFRPFFTLLYFWNFLGFWVITDTPPPPPHSTHTHTHFRKILNCLPIFVWTLPLVWIFRTYSWRIKRDGAEKSNQHHVGSNYGRSKVGYEKKCLISQIAHFPSQPHFLHMWLTCGAWVASKMHILLNQNV